MKFIQKSQRKQPKVSFILLDWSVRESFHFLHYLSQQTVPRELDVLSCFFCMSFRRLRASGGGEIS